MFLLFFYETKLTFSGKKIRQQVVPEGDIYIHPIKAVLSSILEIKRWILNLRSYLIRFSAIKSKRRCGRHDHPCSCNSCETWNEKIWSFFVWYFPAFFFFILRTGNTMFFILSQIYWYTYIRAYILYTYKHPHVLRMHTCICTCACVCMCVSTCACVWCWW